MKRHAVQPVHWLQNFHNDVEKLFERQWDILVPNDDASSVATGGWVPQVDIKEREDAFVIHADLPGVEPDKVEVFMDEGVLTLRGETQKQSQEEKENYLRTERTVGCFYRQFALPESVDGQAIKAVCKNGVLEVTLPKKQTTIPNRIDIKVDAQ